LQEVPVILQIHSRLSHFKKKAYYKAIDTWYSALEIPEKKGLRQGTRK
jgi:hypothetical protein